MASIWDSRSSWSSASRFPLFGLGKTGPL
jgi:hypothetical protein